MTLNMCGCIDKLCKTKLLKDIIKFQCPGVMLIQMIIKIAKENIFHSLTKQHLLTNMPNSSRNCDFERFGGL